MNKSTNCNEQEKKNEKRSKMKKKMKKKRTKAVTVHTQTETLILLQQCPHTVAPPCSPCGRGVSQDVSSNRLLGISGEHGGTVHLRHHLVGDHYGYAKLIRREESREVTAKSDASVQSSSSSAAFPFSLYYYIFGGCMDSKRSISLFHLRINMKLLKTKTTNIQIPGRM